MCRWVGIKWFETKKAVGAKVDDVTGHVKSVESHFGINKGK
jgi:hypothetical protein